MKKYIVNYLKRHPFLRNVARKIIMMLKKIEYLFYFPQKVNNKQIILEAFMGRSYCDSPKAIYNYMINNSKYKDYKFIWAFKKSEDKQELLQNDNTIIVKYGSNEYKKYYATSKYWISNSRIPDYIIKKKKQVFIQTWHGTPLKKLGYDILVEGGNALNTIKDIRKKYLSDAKKYDYFISPSKYCTEKFISSFNLKNLNKENIIIEKGYPRNDYLINYTNKEILKIKNNLKLPKDKKIILYAPTWRDNQHTSGIGYTYNTEVNFDFLKEKLSNEYIILFRAHYFIANSFDFKKYKNFIYDVSSYDDINELYIISDILITDYSSVFFDYSILKRPMIFYMYDLDFYQNKLRDFYINIDELPGDIVKNEKDLIKSVEKSKNFKYNSKYKKFNKKFTYLDDGNASERVVKEIF